MELYERTIVADMYLKLRSRLAVKSGVVQETKVGERGQEVLEHTYYDFTPAFDPEKWSCAVRWEGEQIDRDEARVQDRAAACGFAGYDTPGMSFQEETRRRDALNRFCEYERAAKEAERQCELLELFSEAVTGWPKIETLSDAEVAGLGG